MCLQYFTYCKINLHQNASIIVFKHNISLSIIRMPTASYTGNTTGSPTVTTDGADTILTYTSSGTYTA